MGNFMKALLIIALISFLISNSSFCQIDSNKIFISSKGYWQYPIDKIKRIEKYEDYSKKLDNYIAGKSITFISDENSQVRATHEGRIVLVSSYDQLFIVVIKFGDYYIAYSNLTNPEVKKGDWITRGKAIGRMCKNEIGEFECDLALNLKEKELDPASWFKKAAHNIVLALCGQTW